MTSNRIVAERFGQNLARYKRERELSLEQIAERASIHRTHVGFLIRGKRLAQIDTVIKLATALEVTPNDLLEGITWEAPRESAPEGEFTAKPSKAGEGSR